VSVGVTPFAVIGPPIDGLSQAQDSVPASGYRDTGAPRAPPRNVLA
jgi:hypothetical protein